MEDFEKTVLSTEEFIGGWLGGIGGLLTSHPIDTMKVRQQETGVLLLEAIKATYRYEGISGFYKGLGFPVMMAGIQNAIFFGVYANVFRCLREECQNPNKELLCITVSGCCAGLVQVLCTTPVEIIKIRLQIRTAFGHDQALHPSILSNIKSIYNHLGIRGFYHGFFATAMRDVPSGGLYISIYVQTNQFLQGYMNIYWSHLVSGGLAGALSYAPLTPFDVVKTKIQADSIMTPKYFGMIDCIKKNFKEHGFRTFWRGFGPSLLRSFVNNATLFMVYEFCLEYMS